MYIGSKSAISRSTGDQIDEAEDDKRNKKEVHKIANIAVEQSHSGQSTFRSIRSAEQDNEVVIQTIRLKPRSLSCGSPMPSRCHASQYTDKRRRNTFSPVSESITVGEKIISEETMQGGNHRRHKVTIHC